MRLSRSPAAAARAAAPSRPSTRPASRVRCRATRRPSRRHASRGENSPKFAGRQSLYSAATRVGAARRSRRQCLARDVRPAASDRAPRARCDAAGGCGQKRSPPPVPRPRPDRGLWLRELGARSCEFGFSASRVRRRDEDDERPLCETEREWCWCSDFCAATTCCSQRCVATAMPLCGVRTRKRAPCCAACAATPPPCRPVLLPSCVGFFAPKKTYEL